ncbi:hypothetical protein HKX48_005111 [Thoreauomyces humboldtii]|nr:hypothetical protein HKX48_005111 [Thoreauomyces humboldtii]
MLMHSHEVGEILEKSRAIKRYIKSGKLMTLLLPETTKLNNRQDLSWFLTRNETWNMLPPESEHILFFQLDSIICSNSDQAVEDYFRFDYVGAPWPHAPDVLGGNGGFSLRRKSRLLRCLQHRTWHRGEDSEDAFYAHCLASFPDAVLPTFEEGMKFAIEGQDSERYLGIHKPSAGLKVGPHLDFCPEAALLFLP